MESLQQSILFPLCLFNFICLILVNIAQNFFMIVICNSGGQEIKAVSGTFLGFASIILRLCWNRNFQIYGESTPCCWRIHERPGKDSIFWVFRRGRVFRAGHGCIDILAVTYRRCSGGSFGQSVPILTRGTRPVGKWVDYILSGNVHKIHDR